MAANELHTVPDAAPFTAMSVLGEDIAAPVDTETSCSSAAKGPLIMRIQTASHSRGADTRTPRARAAALHGPSEPSDTQRSETPAMALLRRWRQLRTA